VTSVQGSFTGALELRGQVSHVPAGVIIVLPAG